MEKKKTTTRRRPREVSGGAPDSPGSAAGDVLQQARGWGQVAQQAYDDCEKGKDAEAELHRRRNRSGQ